MLLEALEENRPVRGQIEVTGRPLREHRRDLLVVDFLESDYMIESLNFRENLCLSTMKRMSRMGFVMPRQAKAIEQIFRDQYQVLNQDLKFERTSLSFAEKMAVYLYRIRLRKWKILFCRNMENVMSYELEDMIKSQLREMASVHRGICICADTFEKYLNLADYFLVVTGSGTVEKFTCRQLQEYFDL